MITTADEGRAKSIPVLNAYEIINAGDFTWEAAIYNVTIRGGLTPKEVGTAREIIWRARKTYADLCKGYGFSPIDLNEETVAVPAHWLLPNDVNIDGYDIKLVRKTIVSEKNESILFARLIKEAIKTHFKENGAANFGPMWQDFNSFCEFPQSASAGGFEICRRYDFDAKQLKDRWVIRFGISSAVVDGTSINGYYESGDVATLADKIYSKLENRKTRNGKPVKIRLWYAKENAGKTAKVYELFDPRQILNDAKLSADEQTRRSSFPVICNEFPSGQVQLAGNRCFLILDSNITQDDHEETILSPEQRVELGNKLSKFVNGCRVNSTLLELSPLGLSLEGFPFMKLQPPAVHVRDKNGGKIIGEIFEVNEDTLERRVKERSDHIRRFGFFDSRPINPLLVVPNFLKGNAAAQIQGILNDLLESRGCSIRFGVAVSYGNVGDIASAVSQGDHDALFAVLKEGRNATPSANDTHEQIKQRIAVPSQCIYHDNATLQRYQTNDPKAARRVRNQLDLSLGNLLVKAHWFPFLPAQSFHYNLHVGIDVGGRMNDHVMACFGYGFGNPSDGLMFRPSSIHVDGHQVEPVDSGALYNGLLRNVEDLYNELSADERPDFEKVLFIRDGRFLGSGDDWNEIDALKNLHTELKNRGWISNESVWTGVEIMKAAEGWRIFEFEEQYYNPVVGLCSFPFRDSNEAILCTTGRPYLNQGTASPLKIRVIDIHGKAEAKDVAREIVWEADMCFTKPDMGMSLPFTLSVADTGALLLSRSYKISGITV